MLKDMDKERSYLRAQRGGNKKRFNLFKKNNFLCVLCG